MNQSNGALAGLTPEELREAVRAVLREVLPAGTVAAPSDAPSSDVVISTDADLTAFVRRVAAMCEDPRASCRAPGRAARVPARGGSRRETGRRRGAGDTRIERGAVTERTVLKAAADGARLLLGRRAVLTPLARDKARSMGVEIEKEL